MLMGAIALILPIKLQRLHPVAESPTRALTVRFEFVQLRNDQGILFRSRNNEGPLYPFGKLNHVKILGFFTRHV